MLRETIGNKYGAVLAICEGRLASIDAVYINDDKVTRNGEGWVQGMPGERFGSGDLLRVSTRLGLPVETRHTILDPTFSDFWPADARGDGIASIAVFAQHRSKESFGRHFPNGEPLASVVQTPVCFDWRDPTQNRAVPLSWKACANPVVWAVHCEWARFGRNWDRCIAPVLADLTDEADYCDEPVALKAGGTEPRYRLAGNYAANTEPGAVRNAILACMDGWMSTNGRGHMILKAGRYVAPTFVIEPEHIEGYTWRAFQIDEEACNELIVAFVNPEQDFTEVQAGVWRDESDITDTGRLRTENLAFPWVTSRSQAMRLAKRKMSRVNAKRRGTVRTGVYGLNGLGQRYIRVRNTDLASMADVVVEVMNVEFDGASGQVVFDVVLADTGIDAWDPAEEEGELPDPVIRPDPEPANQNAARTVSSRSVQYPMTSVSDAITIETFTGLDTDGTLIVFPAAVIDGLAELTRYGVFWRGDVGYEVEVHPAPNHMQTGSWIFLGWMSTSDAGGDYDPDPVPPGGWGGSNQQEVVTP
ncbi:MAG TPA: hypothetical protein VN018_05330 [Brevundimonas sp.]|nr:hypothetical protein [Brevundimonas sp.]